MKSLKVLITIVVFSTVLTSCFEDQDDNIINNTDIKDFVYRGMDAFYLYRNNVPNLVEDKLASNQYQSYLESYNTPESIFESLIFNRQNTDKFSWIVDDYLELEQQFSGVSKSNGMDFMLQDFPAGSDNLIGIVRLVLPNTIAEANGLQRGSLFNAINGTPLTVNNYKSLLREDNYTVNLAIYNTNGTPNTNDDTIDATTNTVNLFKVQYEENPVFKTEILQVEGENVGYLMYNGFTRNFNTALNNAFGVFRANNVQHLVLDLRYNPGGSVNTASLLGSMVTGQFNGEIFAKLQFNNLQQDRNSNYTFENNIEGETLNSLNLNKVYILATGWSASASEMTINSLNAYIDVVHIGSQTVGKSQASITLYDSPNFGRSEADPRHTYAMQPLVAITVNKLDVQVPTQGIIQNILVEEQINNLGVLGQPEEPLLAEALAQIALTNRVANTTKSKPVKHYFDSNDLVLHKKEMHIE